MAGSHADRTGVMEFRVIALYPGRIAAVSGRPGVRFRRRKRLESTLVPCRINTVDGRSFAAPEHAVPDGTSSPQYRAQIEMVRVAVDDRRVVHVLLSAEADASKVDPEQVLLSPIFDDGHRMIFEFQRAHIVSVTSRGELETRLVAVHPVLGVIGTKTIHRFNTRFSALGNRCMEYLGGAIDLFPFRERPTRMSRIPIPDGAANLHFDDAPEAVAQDESEQQDHRWRAMGEASSDWEGG